jgi:hypothetical protein
VRIRIGGVVSAILGGLLVAAPVAPAADGAPVASGTFTVGKKSYRFVDAVAFRTTKLNGWPGERVTVAVLTADPIDRRKVAASVAETGNWMGSGHEARFILRFDDRGKLLWAMFQADAKNIGLLRLGDVVSEMAQEGGKVRGRLTIPKPADFFGEPYTFEVAFHADVVASR